MKSYAVLSVAALAASLMVGCGGKNTTTPAASNSNLTNVPPPAPNYGANGGGATASNTGGATQNVGYNDPAPITQPPITDTKARPATGGADPAPGVKYTVKKGDTLWNIAQRAYGDGKQYKKIVAANSIKGDKVAVGQTLSIPN